MAQFSFDDYKKRAAAREAKAAAGANGNTEFAKVGFFKLKNSGDVAIARINYASTADFMLANYHQLDASQKYMKVLCLDDNCPLCAAAKAQADSGKGQTISKAKDRIFIPMVVAYRNPDGSFTTPEPVIMDASAAGRTDYALILSRKIDDFGSLKDHVFKITRNGTGLETTYSFDYVPTVDNESIISKASLSAFGTFKIDKHSYWVKSAEDIRTFLSTGSFPVAATNTAPAANAAPVAPATPTAPAYQAPAAPTFAQAEANPYNAPTAPAQEAPKAAPTFNGFSF